MRETSHYQAVVISHPDSGHVYGTMSFAGSEDYDSLFDEGCRINEHVDQIKRAWRVELGVCADETGATWIKHPKVMFRSFPNSEEAEAFAVQTQLEGMKQESVEPFLRAFGEQQTRSMLDSIDEVLGALTVQHALDAPTELQLEDLSPETQQSLLQRLNTPGEAIDCSDDAAIDRLFQEETIADEEPDSEDPPLPFLP